MQTLERAYRVANTQSVSRVNLQRDLIAALDTAKGTVFIRCWQRHRPQEYLDFLRQIDHNVPPDPDVHVIVDNYATHKHPRVKEIWFNRITQPPIRRRTLRNVKELVTKIDQFVATGVTP